MLARGLIAGLVCGSFSGMRCLLGGCLGTVPPLWYGVPGASGFGAGLAWGGSCGAAAVFVVVVACARSMVLWMVYRGVFRAGPGGSNRFYFLLI